MVSVPVPPFVINVASVVPFDVRFSADELLNVSASTVKTIPEYAVNDP